MRLDGKNIVLTGATRGIGRALASQLIGQGATVIAVARDGKALKQLHQELGSGVSTITCDLAKRSARDELIRQLEGHSRPIDGLINNAGIQSATDFMSAKPDTLADNIDLEVAVNLVAPMHLCAALLPHLSTRHEAFVLNVSSALALAPKQDAPVYCATKAGLSNFSTGFRYQAQQASDEVIVCDGIMALVDTDMTQGRGHGKITAEQAARELLVGIQWEKRRMWVGKTLILSVLHRISPALVARILR